LRKTATPDPGGRIAAIDALRGLAILAMIVYHFSWDLSYFGMISVDVVQDPGWKAFARMIAGSFIGLVGISLVLATRSGLRWRPYLRRLAIIVAAALLVTFGTWYLFPDAFVFFGILHLIAFASVAALPFLRLPIPIVFLVGAVVLALPFFVTAEVFNDPLLWWVGFTPHPPNTVDYVPVFPWFAMALFGIVAGRLFLRFGSDSAFACWVPKDIPGRVAVGAGRWSLLIYLAHQPILIGILTVVAPLVTPDPMQEATIFTRDCVTTCRTAGRGPAVCEAYCGCVLDGIQKGGFLSQALSGRMSAQENDRWLALISQCRPAEDGQSMLDGPAASD
jgi:uncharacterized membrane protein